MVFLSDRAQCSGKHCIESWTDTQQQLTNTDPQRAGWSQRSSYLELWAGITQPVAFITTGCPHSCNSTSWGSCYQPAEDQERNMSCSGGSEEQSPESSGEHKAEVLKWEQLIAWQMVELPTGAQKTVGSARLDQKSLNLSVLEKKGGKNPKLRETKPITSILLLKRTTEYANRKKSHPIPQKHLKIQSQKYMGSPSTYHYLTINQRKHSKSLMWIMMKSQTGFSYLDHLQEHHEWAAEHTRWQAKEDNTRQAQGSVLLGTGTSTTAPQGAEQTQQQSACSKEAGPKQSQEANLARQSCD